MSSKLKALLFQKETTEEKEKVSQTSEKVREDHRAGKRLITTVYTEF